MAKSKRSSMKKKMKKERLNDPEFKEKMRENLKKMLSSTENGGRDIYVEPEKEYDKEVEMESEDDIEIKNRKKMNKKMLNKKKNGVGKQKIKSKKSTKSGSYGKRLLRIKSGYR